MANEIQQWHPTATMTPPENVLLVCITESGQEVEFKYISGLWFLPDASMYVYYTPVWWREKEVPDGA